MTAATATRKTTEKTRSNGNGSNGNGKRARILALIVATQDANGFYLPIDRAAAIAELTGRDKTRETTRTTYTANRTATRS